MKTPNKIYVSIPSRLRWDDPKYVGIAWSDKAYLTTQQIEEYIRKDIVDETIKTAEDHAYFAGREKLRETLLEWAKAVKAGPMIPMNIDKVINKIESL